MPITKNNIRIPVNITRSLFFIGLLLLFYSPFAKASSLGYMERYVFPKDQSFCKPVFCKGFLFAADHSDGIYQFTSDGRRTVHQRREGRIVDIKTYEEKLLILRNKDNVSYIDIINPDDLSVTDTIKLEKNKVQWDKPWLYLSKAEPIDPVQREYPSYSIDSLHHNRINVSYNSHSHSSPYDSYLEISQKYIINDILPFREKNRLYLKAVNLDYPGLQNILKIDGDSGEILWTYPTGGRLTSENIILLNERIYFLRDIRDSHFLLEQLDSKTGTLLQSYKLGRMFAPKITANHEGDCCQSEGVCGSLTADRIYLLNQTPSEYGCSSSLTVFKSDFTGDKTFVISPYEELIYSYSNFLYAANYHPQFRKYLAHKGDADLQKLHRTKIQNAVDHYEKIIEQNPLNPYFHLYYLLARLEGGAGEAALWDEVLEVEKKCGFNVFDLSLTGSLLLRYGYRHGGNYLLNKASEYAPAAYPDYQRAFALLSCSPAANMSAVLQRMAKDHSFDLRQITEMMEHIAEITPSGEYNYYAWSALSSQLKKEGKKDASLNASAKAAAFFKTGGMLTPYDTALYDLLSVLTSALGIIFVVLSLRSIFMANLKKNHYLSEITGKPKIESFFDFYEKNLQPREKNILGFVITTALITLAADIVLLLLMSFTKESLKQYYLSALGLSIILGLIAVIFLMIYSAKLERRYFKSPLNSQENYYKNIIKNSFLPFMDRQEKIMLAVLSIAGIILAWLLLGMESSVSFIRSVPPPLLAGCYGNDTSLTLLKNKVKTNPNNPHTNLLMAYEMHLRNDWEKAEEFYLRYLAYRPRDLNARANLALARSAVNPEEAVFMLEKIVRNHRNDYNKATIQYNIKLLEQEGMAELGNRIPVSIPGLHQYPHISAQMKVNPGKLLIIPPDWRQEKGGLFFDYDLSRVFFSYLYPFTAFSRNEGITDSWGWINNIALMSALFIYWFWNIILLVSIFFTEDPLFLPYFCRRCGKLICEKCAEPDPREWCVDCKENLLYHVPNIIHFIIPGIKQLRYGEGIRGILMMCLFVYGLIFSFILFFPFREGVTILVSGGNRYLGSLQALTAPQTIFPYNVVQDPSFFWFVLAAAVLPPLLFVLNFLEILKSGNYIDIMQAVDFENVETQLLEYKTIKTKLLQEAGGKSYHTKLITQPFNEKCKVKSITKSADSADPVD